MQKPNIDDNLTLLADFGKTEAICVDVLDNPATEEGIWSRSWHAVPSNKASRSG